jgi:hypothetical protein
LKQSISLSSLKQSDAPELVSQPWLATCFGVWPITIKKRVQRGELPQPTIRIGRQQYWDRKTLLDWLAEKHLIDAR